MLTEDRLKAVKEEATAEIEASCTPIYRSYRLADACLALLEENEQLTHDAAEWQAAAEDALGRIATVLASHTPCDSLIVAGSPACHECEKPYPCSTAVDLRSENDEDALGCCG